MKTVINLLAAGFVFAVIGLCCLIVLYIQNDRKQPEKIETSVFAQLPSNCTVYRIRSNKVYGDVFTTICKNGQVTTESKLPVNQGKTSRTISRIIETHAGIEEDYD